MRWRRRHVLATAGGLVSASGCLRLASEPDSTTPGGSSAATPTDHATTNLTYNITVIFDPIGVPIISYSTPIIHGVEFYTENEGCLFCDNLGDGGKSILVLLFAIKTEHF
jgi:hypothetical protein